MKLVPFKSLSGSPFTVRQILVCSDLDKMLSVLGQMHGNSDNTEGYRKVYQTLLAKPPAPQFILF